LQANESIGAFCSDYNYEGCQNDPECVWCLERGPDAGAGCLHLSRSAVIDDRIILQHSCLATGTQTHTHTF